MNAFIVNWRTTLLGIATMAGGVAALCKTLAAGQLDFTTISTELALITGGITGIFAKDHNVTGAGDSAVSK